MRLFRLQVQSNTCVRFAVVIYSLFVITLTLIISANLFSLYSVKTRFCQNDDAKLDKVGDGRSNFYIPHHIHQMFFNITDKIIPNELEKARKTWILHHPRFNYTLWNAQMVLGLIKAKHPELLPLYESYSHWVRRADVGRYVILYEYGGIYVDLDISAQRALESLIRTFNRSTDTVLYYTQPVGVSNDFMMAKARTPFFKHVICGLEAGNRWYLLPYITTLMTTGPGYLYGKYKTYDRPRDISIIEESVLSTYLRHKDGGAWHGADGKAIWWIYVKRDILVKITCIVLMSAVILTVVLRIFNRTISNCYFTILKKLSLLTTGSKYQFKK